MTEREWERGYYCAVAALLREECAVTTAVRSLYAQGGGGSSFADPMDRALFAQHGLTANADLLTKNVDNELINDNITSKLKGLPD